MGCQHTGKRAQAGIARRSAAQMNLKPKDQAVSEWEERMKGHSLGKPANFVLEDWRILVWKDSWIIDHAWGDVKRLIIAKGYHRAKRLV